MPNSKKVESRQHPWNNPPTIKRSSIRNHGSLIPCTARDIGESPFCHHPTGAFLKRREVRRNPRDLVSKAVHKDQLLSSSSVFRKRLVGIMPHTWVMETPLLRACNANLAGLTPYFRMAICREKLFLSRLTPSKQSLTQLSRSPLKSAKKAILHVPCSREGVPSHSHG